MRLYIAGPMRGYPQFNFQKFDEVCKRVEDAGHIAIGPQRLDRLFGINEHSLEEQDITPALMRNFFRRDCIAITDEAEGVVMLDGWECSSGSRFEYALATALGLPVYNEFLHSLHAEVRIRSWTPGGHLCRPN